MYDIASPGSASPSWVLDSRLDETAINTFWIGVRRRSGMTKAKWLGDNDTEKDEDLKDCIVVKSDSDDFSSPEANNHFPRLRSSERKKQK